jgi:hypothetical protein
MEQGLITQILDAFTAHTGIKANWQPVKNKAPDTGIDGYVKISFGKEKLILPVQVKTNIRFHHLPQVVQLHKQYKSTLVLADDILPKIKNDFKDVGINYIDSAGNAFIKNKDIFILIEGQKKDEPAKDFKTKPFSKAGLKIIFQLFINEHLLNATIRHIAEVADTSLDSVHKTINGLKQLNYLIAVKKDTLTWNNKKELLEKWITEYENRLKPGLTMGNFRFVKDKDFLKWKKMPLDNEITQWGAEPAGELLTGYLKPEILTLYTTETKGDLIKKHRILPDPKGYIKVYQKFWKLETKKEKTVPPLLVYADLINTGNNRNIETAQKIYERFLQDKF